MTTQCTHGQLAWQCPTCERDAEIERLQIAIADMLVGRRKLTADRDRLAAENERLRSGEPTEYALHHENVELRAKNARLGKGIAAVAALIKESHGVVGLHLNGNIATWDEMLEGGYMEEWLLDFSAALREEGK